MPMSNAIRMPHAELRLVWKDDAVALLRPAVPSGLTEPVEPDCSACLSLCCIVKRSRSNARRSDSPSWYKRRHTLQVVTGCVASMPNFWVKVCNIIIRFYRSDLTICLLSRELVMGEHWNLSYRYVVTMMISIANNRYFKI